MAKLMSDREYATPFPMLHAASLLSHRTRIGKFSEAIRRVVDADSSIVDIGTGTGVLAMLAARAGARRVIALDINPESIEYARRSARLNGLDRRIEFVVGHYRDLVLDELADVVICEMLSSMMLVEQQVPACGFAVRNLLKRNGTVLPQSATVFVVLAECRTLWNRFSVEGLRFPRLPQTVSPNEARDMSDAVELAHFDFTSPESPERIDRRIEFVVNEDGTVHGLVGFFQSTLYGDIRLEMADGWRDVFLPLPHATNVSPGDTLAVRIEFVPGRVDTLRLELES
ncbi:MAG: 50S ribosomal protein L11 methyltransferase [Candidatus Thorarchaeota archaeon]|nr:MAG: hypothetical protein DRO93_02360 [Candidatus Thorarchaeota archaeon]